MSFVFLAAASIAAATPPVPTWSAQDREIPDLPSVVDSHAEPGTEATTHGLRHWQDEDEDEVATAGWANERDLVVSFSGEVGNLYYIMATARGEGLVAHWRQGPIAGENLSVDVPLLLPEELAGPMAELGSVHLSLRLAITTLDGRDLAQQPLAYTEATLEGGRPVGGAPVSEDTLDDGASALDDLDAEVTR